jgi:hypothetical protein
MSDQEKEEIPEKSDGMIKQTIDSVTALTRSVPIYQDAIQPLAKETGKALGTIGKAVNVALSPLSLVIWGYDQVSDFLETIVAQKLEKIPENRIIPPPPNVAGPAIESLKFSGHDETLREMFANLIANSIDSETVQDAHPSFVDIIRNLTPDEGLILKLFISQNEFPMLDVIFKHNKGTGYNRLQRNVSLIGIKAGCTHPNLVVNYLDNLSRLGLLEVPSGARINDLKQYEPVKSHPDIQKLVALYERNPNGVIKYTDKLIVKTDMGQQFINACVIDKKDRT